LKEFKGTPNFIGQALRLFDLNRNDLYQMTPSDWIEPIRCHLDRENAIITKWLLFDETYGIPLRGAVHDLKKHVQNVNNSLKKNTEVPDEAIIELRKATFQLHSHINRLIKKSIYEADRVTYVDLNQIIKPITQKIQDSYDVNVFIMEGINLYVPIDAFILRSALLNLLHNAVEGVLKSSSSREISISVLRNQDNKTICLSLSNAYVPEAKPMKTSSGIGLNEARYLIETLCKGRLFVEPDPEQRIWNVRIVFQDNIGDS